MNNWKAVIAAVLLAVTAFCTLAAAAGGMAYAVWTRPDFYDRVISRSDAYPALTNLLLDWMERGLPHGREASRYLRITLSPEWVQAQTQDILDQVSDYVLGKTDKKPRINVAALKEMVYDSLPMEKTQQQRRNEAWTLLSPLPDSAVWSDFLSPEPLYTVREAVKVLRYILLGLGGALLIALGLWWALEGRFSRALHWLGGAFMAGGFMGILFCAIAWLLIPRLLVFWQIEQALLNWGFSYAAAGGLLNGLVQHAALGLGTACAVTVLAGYLLMQVPENGGEQAARPHLKLVKPEPKPFVKYPL
jgi:hypothetical protein